MVTNVQIQGMETDTQYKRLGLIVSRPTNMEPEGGSCRSTGRIAKLIQHYIDDVLFVLEHVSSSIESSKVFEENRRSCR